MVTTAFTLETAGTARRIVTPELTAALRQGSSCLLCTQEAGPGQRLPPAAGGLRCGQGGGDEGQGWVLLGFVVTDQSDSSSPSRRKDGWFSYGEIFTDKWDLEKRSRRAGGRRDMESSW